MLPSHFPSRPSSPTSLEPKESLSSTTEDPIIINKKRITNVVINTESIVPLSFEAILKDPILLKQHTPNITIGVIAVILVFFFLRAIFGESEGFKRSYNGTKNWGDYVALGRSRNAMLAQTPKPYALLGDKYVGGQGSLYHGPVEIPDPDKSKKSSTKSSNSRNMNFEVDRHGIFGGSSTEWTTGIVGMGGWLGNFVDMRKESAIEKIEVEEDLTSERRKALTEHILEHAWSFIDAEDEANAAKLLFEARRDKYLKGLPLRDRVRNDEVAMKGAAKGWSRLYGVMEGEGVKSALEVQVEKLVRRVPLVIFSKTTCPHSTRAKALLAKYKLTPEAHIVELDLRPDGKNLKGLLTRRTLHSTFPNIIIGSRSIGGADDLELLEKESKLKGILEAAGIVTRGF